MPQQSGRLRRYIVGFGLLGVMVVAHTEASNGNLQGQQTTNGVTVAQNKFYCNVKAFNPAERENYKALSHKLNTARLEVVETEHGYTFRLDPFKISVVDVADWVTAENKCCPFFNFQVELADGGKQLSLHLTGDDGVKPFIRSEFKIS